MLKDLFHLMYPELCAVCGEALVRQERHICMACLNAFPQTGIHTWPGNEVERRFWGKVPVERGIAFFYYEKESALQQAIFQLKYRGEKELGTVLGRYAGTALAEAGVYDAVDVIVPVPLHPKKRAKRGYNQSLEIARGVSAVTRIPITSKALKRKSFEASQTKMNRWQRNENVEDVFLLTDGNAVKGKHILIIDDVVTTGATVISCAKELMKAGGTRFSVMSLGFTKG